MLTIFSLSLPVSPSLNPGWCLRKPDAIYSPRGLPAPRRSGFSPTTRPCRAEARPTPRRESPWGTWFRRFAHGTLAGTLLGILLVTLSPDSRAEAQPGDPQAAYKAVDMKDLVPKSRTTIPGQRAIFAPTPIKFKARLLALPTPQKTEYLNMALSMMKVSSPPKVSQRIGLDYGGEKPLAAYIEEGAATRLVANVKVGQALTFYAFHVYNANSGPALVVTSFAD